MSDLLKMPDILIIDQTHSLFLCKNAKNDHKLSSLSLLKHILAEISNLPAHQALIKFMQITPLDIQRLFLLLLFEEH